MVYCDLVVYVLVVVELFCCVVDVGGGSGVDDVDWVCWCMVDFWCVVC